MLVFQNTENDKLDHLMAWKAFCTDYFTAWKQRNKPYSLLVDGYTGNIGIIRYNSLSLRRSLSEFEKNYASKFSISFLRIRASLALVSYLISI